MPLIIGLFDNSAIDFGWLLRERMGGGMVVGVVMTMTVAVAVAAVMMTMMLDIAPTVLLMVGGERMASSKKRKRHE